MKCEMVRKRVRERNFFPGYVLVNADLSNGEANHVITSIPGVIGFLDQTRGELPKPLNHYANQKSIVS
jgi:transcription termination/antitermination protein NusG